MKPIVMYAPVIHQGYLALFNRHPGNDICLISHQSVKEFDPVMADQLSRDIRSVPPEYVQSMLSSLYSNTRIVVLKSIKEVAPYCEIIMNDDDISRMLLRHLPSTMKVTFDNTFLRWDWTKSTVPNKAEGNFPVTTDGHDRFVMGMAWQQAGKSSDFWRIVGAAVPFPDGGMTLAAFNEHLPNTQAPYVNGDPRLHMNPGEKPEICTAIHAEQNIIATAAKEGKALNGLSIYVTTFPCSVCARAIRTAGFKKVFFKEGYSNLDAAEVLLHAGIEIFQVK